MDIQRLRNLTTGKLHTIMRHIYEDLESITGEKGIMTHMIPAARQALLLYLRKHVQDPRFWDGLYDTTHVGEYPVPIMSEAEKLEYFDRFRVELTNFPPFKVQR